VHCMPLVPCFPGYWAGGLEKNFWYTCSCHVSAGILKFNETSAVSSNSPEQKEHRDTQRYTDLEHIL